MAGAFVRRVTSPQDRVQAPAALDPWSGVHPDSYVCLGRASKLSGIDEGYLLEAVLNGSLTWIERGGVLRVLVRELRSLAWQLDLFETPVLQGTADRARS